MNPELDKITDIRKTTQIDRELSRLNIDVACLQETRLADSGSYRECNFTFFWHGKSASEVREYGVGFAVRNSLLNSVEPPVAISERIITLKLSTKVGTATVISAYAPTLQASDDTKDQFYDSLIQVMSRIPISEKVYLLGDFNARVGADHATWPMCLGMYGVGKINENGQRLLEFCAQFQLCITSTFFSSKKTTQGILETPSLWPLASAGPCDNKKI